MKTASCATLCFLLMLAACKGGDRRLPDAAGGQGEVLVVMSKSEWEGELGAAVRSILEQPTLGLPQREARFQVAQTTPQNFGSLLEVHHSVLFADLNGVVDSASVTYLHDRHAKGQLLVRIAAGDRAAWTRLAQQRGDDIAQAFEDHQRERTTKRLLRERDAAQMSSLKAQFGIHLEVPGGYRVVEMGSDFAWLQRDRVVTSGSLDHNVIEGLLIHRHPYSEDFIFSVPFLVDVRDRVSRQFVKGPTPGSFMVVQRGFEGMDLMPLGRNISVGGKFAYVMHGLYGMQGAKMGGPFVSLSMVDEANSRVVTAEGFVYAPQFDKREYMREMEALVYSLRISGDTTP